MVLIFVFTILNAHAYNELRVSKTDKALPLLSAKAMMIIHIILAVVFFFMFIWFCYRVWSGPGARAIRSEPFDRRARLMESEVGDATNAVGRAIKWAGERGNKEISVRDGQGSARRLIDGTYVDEKDTDALGGKRVYHCSAGNCNDGDQTYFNTTLRKLQRRDKKYEDEEIYKGDGGKYYLGKRSMSHPVATVHVDDDDFLPVDTARTAPRQRALVPPLEFRTPRQVEPIRRGSI